MYIQNQRFAFQMHRFFDFFLYIIDGDYLSCYTECMRRDILLHLTNLLRERFINNMFRQEGDFIFFVADFGNVAFR